MDGNKVLGSRFQVFGSIEIQGPGLRGAGFGVRGVRIEPQFITSNLEPRTSYLNPSAI
jgi:hypothetical protein